jgi:hypothetical protein
MALSSSCPTHSTSLLLIYSLPATFTVVLYFHVLCRASFPYFPHFFSSGPESIATLPPFGPIEGQKGFDQISSQWECQKNRFAFISFGKSRFKPPTIWDQLFMTTVSECWYWNPIPSGRNWKLPFSLQWRGREICIIWERSVTLAEKRGSEAGLGGGCEAVCYWVGRISLIPCLQGKENCF